MTSRARLTVLGSDALERRLWALLDGIADVARAHVPAGSLRALVLLGGYGRGEGGVVREGGEEHPHNNLDLLLVTRERGLGHRAEARRLGEGLQRALEEIGARAGIGIDVGAVGDLSLSRAPCLVMWSDMQQGHRTLAGDADFVTSLRFRPTDIEPDDVARLVANRVTLLVINRALLRRGPAALSADVQRAIVRHAMKAIVGVGDALLFARGLYDGSYLVKRDRMRALGAAAPARLAALYDEAIAYRLAPRAVPMPHAALEAWNEELVRLASEVHLSLEAARLAHPGLAWSDHPRASLRHAVRGLSIGRAARAARDLAAGRLPVAALLPLVAYGAGAPLAGRLLSSPPDAASLDLAYLRAWARRGDPAFAAVARKLGLDLTPPAPRPVGALLSEVSA